MKKWSVIQILIGKGCTDRYHSKVKRGSFFAFPGKDSFVPMVRLHLPSMLDRLSLDDSITYFRREYYDALDQHNTIAKQHLDELLNADVHQLLPDFCVHCNQLLEKVKASIIFFTEQIVPYSLELHEKAKSGHNCTSCSGNCDMGHRILLQQLHLNHQQLYQSFYDLQTTALPLYSNLDYPDVYQLLRDDIQVLQAKVYELIYLEESLLIPKFLELQKKINARVV